MKTNTLTKPNNLFNAHFKASITEARGKLSRMRGINIPMKYICRGCVYYFSDIENEGLAPFPTCKRAPPKYGTPAFYDEGEKLNILDLNLCLPGTT